VTVPLAHAKAKKSVCGGVKGAHLLTSAGTGSTGLLGAVGAQRLGGGWVGASGKRTATKLTYKWVDKTPVTRLTSVGTTSATSLWSSNYPLYVSLVCRAYGRT
jgi:hypothetical protein